MTPAAAGACRLATAAVHAWKECDSSDRSRAGQAVGVAAGADVAEAVQDAQQPGGGGRVEGQVGGQVRGHTRAEAEGVEDAQPYARHQGVEAEDAEVVDEHRRHDRQPEGRGF
ncbi:hypothetical protein [Nonomuraea sp. NPDC046570]|uniref:hypothetical protein n=1 Tax=Nonomuraea sp. NPDC046570 TaxID=3155255 RepID=UPI0034110A29